MNPEIFCCQPFKNEWKLVVLLLFSSCFAAIFKLFALLFSNFDEFRIFSEICQNFFRFFSKISENFLKIFWIFLKKFWNFSEIFWKNSEKIVNREIFCCQRFKNEWKLAVLLLFSNFLRCFSRILTNFRNFSDFFQKFSRNFWFLKKFWKKLWKICESRDFLLPAIQKWMKTSCFAAVFKVFS